MNNRYTFRPIANEPHKVEVVGLEKTALCWLPASAAAQVETVYYPLWKRDPVFANEFMRGYLFGVHHALTFGNMAPDIDVQVDDHGVLTLAMAG